MQLKANRGLIFGMNTWSGRKGGGVVCKFFDRYENSRIDDKSKCTPDGLSGHVYALTKHLRSHQNVNVVKFSLTSLKREIY